MLQQSDYMWTVIPTSQMRDPEAQNSHNALIYMKVL